MNQLETINNTLEELEEAFFDIPFENSEFQNKNFVIAAQLTPARAYRAIGLKMFSKIQAIKENLFQLQLADIDIEEKEYKINQTETNDFERRRLQIEVLKLRDSRKWTEKLFNDALRELDSLYKELQKYPKYTREQFEAEERLHYQLKLEQQIRAGNGSIESLANMQVNNPQLENMLNEPELLKLKMKEVEVATKLLK